MRVWVGGRAVATAVRNCNNKIVNKEESASLSYRRLFPK
jgi:hypothetical protein